MTLLTTFSFPTRAEVEHANGSRMKSLSGQEMVFTAVDSGNQDPTQRAKTLSNFMAQETLTLKKGAQVMLIKIWTGASSMDPQEKLLLSCTRMIILFIGSTRRHSTELIFRKT